MSDCQICQHAKILVINAAIADKLAPGLIVWRYLRHIHSADVLLQAHQQDCLKIDAGCTDSEQLTKTRNDRPIPHLRSSPPMAHPTPPAPPLPMLGLEMDERLQSSLLAQHTAERQFRAAWQSMDTRSQQRNLAWLQEQLLGLDWSIS